MFQSSPPARTTCFKSKTPRCGIGPLTQAAAETGITVAIIARLDMARVDASERRASARFTFCPAADPHRCEIKTGISDGVVTEVVEGLKEGDRVVTAEIAAKSQPASTPANPFSGGQRRFP